MAFSTLALTECGFRHRRTFPVKIVWPLCARKQQKKKKKWVREAEGEREREEWIHLVFETWRGKTGVSGGQCVLA